jgi:chromate reductase
MSQTYKVAVIVGSLRKGAYSRMTAKAMIAVAPANLQLEIVEIGDLSMYNQDLDTDSPPTLGRLSK